MLGVGFTLLESGPKGFRMAYQYGGVGAPGYPENPSWFQWTGRFWNHTFGVRVVPDPDESQVWMVTEAGTFRRFADLGLDGLYASHLPADEYRRLEWLGVGNGWVLHGLDGTQTYFLANGLWDRTVDRNDKTVQGSYDSLGRLAGITFPGERSLTIQYNNSTGKLDKVIENAVTGTPDTPRTWTFVWLADTAMYPRLSRIDRPDGSRWRFGYDTAALPHLVRIFREGPGGSPSRVEAAWEYDASGNLVSAWKGSDSFSTGVERLTWEYFSETETRVTDDYGKTTTYTFERETASGKPRVSSISGECPSCGLDPNSAIEYDNPANPGHPLLPWKITNGAGATTELTYTDFGRVETRTEALASIDERTTSWTYDANYPGFPTSRTGPSVVPSCPTGRETPGSTTRRTATCSSARRVAARSSAASFRPSPTGPTSTTRRPLAPSPRRSTHPAST